MVTLLLYGILALVAVGCLYGLAMLFLAREQISRPAADRAPWRLRDRALEPQDIVEMRLPVALRGYRFAETDLLLDRLTEELRERDDEIARLKGGIEVLTAPQEAAVVAPSDDAVTPRRTSRRSAASDEPPAVTSRRSADEPAVTASALSRLHPSPSARPDDSSAD